MRLDITRKADLAARALLVLGQLDRRVKAAELAERIGTTPGFLTQVLAPLVANHWVGSEPGPTGGYALSTPLAELSVLAVIEAVEGPTDTTSCVLEDRLCSSAGGAEGPCPLHVPWSRAREILLAELARTTLASIPAPLAPPPTPIA